MAGPGACAIPARVRNRTAEAGARHDSDPTELEALRESFLERVGLNVAIRAAATGGAAAGRRPRGGGSVPG
jgi:hypothetical protein